MGTDPIVEAAATAFVRWICPAHHVRQVTETDRATAQAVVAAVRAAATSPEGIERAARALAKADGWPNWEVVPAAWKATFQYRAEAAIRAALEPTP
ncbi:MAG: hypothetical protein JWO15_3732 [Sphingomonadales bacterium]|nr:hypothetical protein [Sphingomonadales bacterium]